MAGKPKPTAIKRLTGNPGKRPLPQDEPQPDRTPPKCPAWLQPEARREWRRIVPELERLGLLTLIDRVALAAYCAAYAHWREAEEIMQTEGLTYETVNKAGETTIVSRPEVGIAQKYMGLIRSFCSEFGLTPSSRGRMAVPGHMPDQDPLDQFLRMARN